MHILMHKYIFERLLLLLERVVCVSILNVPVILDQNTRAYVNLLRLHLMEYLDS